MKIAVEGCAHGELEKIYDSIAFIEIQEQIKVDLLICCGDFQSTRNLNDLECMAVPRKFMDICTFYKYYSGEKKAPLLTIFIGGNHEASNYLQELPYGGWVAPNIYYMGYAGVINVNGIKIGGISGIYKGHDYLKGRYEFSPYDKSTQRSVYHVRNVDVYRLKQMSTPIDIFLSHDWPRGIYNYGNANQLVQFKPFLRDEIDRNELGSPACEDLLHYLKPSYWFAAHLHCKFSALVIHDDDNDKSISKSTKFLALDKCLPKRRFLQILDIESNNKFNDDDTILIKESVTINLEYDLEWLAILNLTNHLISVKNYPNYMPGKTGGNNHDENEERYNFTPNEVEKSKVLKAFENNLKIPLNFVKTAESYNSAQHTEKYANQPKSVINPQTEAFCEKLSIDDPLQLAMMISGEEFNHSSYIDDTKDNLNDSKSFCLSQDEIILDCSTPIKIAPLAASLPKPKWIIDNLPSTSSVNVDLNSSSTLTAITDQQEDSVIENCDNKWIEDRTPTKNESRNYSLNDSSLILSPNELTKTADEIVSTTTSEGDINSILLNTTENPPMKKFKRRNQSIYSSLEDD